MGTPKHFTGCEERESKIMITIKMKKNAGYDLLVPPYL